MTDERAERLWGPSPVRAFLSHKAEFKEEAAEIKEALGGYGIAGFLAHEDITPTREWQEEILFALETMDVMIPLLTPGFKDSDWTGQEIGYALARRTPVITVRLGADPYGFIGKYQGLSLTGGTYGSLGKSIFDLMLDHESAELQKLAKDAYVDAVSNAPNFATANQLAPYLPRMNDLSDEQVASLVEAYNSNPQVSSAYKFEDALPQHLTEVTGETHYIERDRSGERKIYTLPF